MNILFWTLQILLALHTAIGAVWKFSNSAEQTMPSLAAIPHGAWLTLSVAELLCALALVIPALHKPLALAAPVAVAFIAAEMLLFSALHISSGAANYSPMIYWLVVAALCVFIIYGRLVLKPL